MKGKKRKKSSNSNYKNTISSKAKAAETVRIDEEVRDRKRLKTIARNILLADVALLGLCQLLLANGLISDFTSGIISMVGIVLMVVALWIQFGNHGHDDNTRSSSSW